MKKKQRKIDKYKDLIKEEYVRESAVHAVMEQCADIICQQDNKMASYFEFLFELKIRRSRIFSDIAEPLVAHKKSFPPAAVQRTQLRWRKGLPMLPA